MTETFSRDTFLAAFEPALSKLEDASAAGASLAEESFKRILLVGCGAPNRMLAVIQYWAMSKIDGLALRRYYPAELLHNSPPVLDSQTLVVLASHSGTTAETVEAARFLHDSGCRCVAITQKAESPLAENVDIPLLYGETTQGYYASLLMALAFFSSYLKAHSAWDLHDAILQSLPHFPAVLAAAMEQTEEQTRNLAESLKEEKLLYFIGAGPTFDVAYVFAACILMEMQWLHAVALNASEFFHGPFEVLDDSLPVLVLLDESPHRPEAERVIRFCEKIGARITVFDSQEFLLDGIHSDVRPMLSPFAIDAALYRFSQHLAEKREHSLSIRRYMGKMEY